MNPVEDRHNHEELTGLIDKCKLINNITLSKLTSGLYWINPEHFLHTGTINGVNGNESLKSNSKASEYLEQLLKIRDSDSNPFPDINLQEFKKKDTASTEDNEYDILNHSVWLVRAAGGDWTGDFVEHGYIGMNYGLDNIDINVAYNRDALLNLYRREVPSATS